MTREEAIKRIRQDLDVNGKYLSKEYKEALQMAIEALSANYTTESPNDVIEQKNDVIADRPSGEWIKHNDRSTIIVYYTCSECGEVESGTPPYCRKCGAKMGSDTR